MTITWEAARAGESIDGVAPWFPAREMAAGKAVVLSITDVLDHLEPVTVGASVETVLDRLDVVLRARPVVVIADLGPARPSRLLVGLLGIMRRRAARASASLVLVDPSSAVQAGLDEARVAALYTTAPTSTPRCGSSKPIVSTAPDGPTREVRGAAPADRAVLGWPRRAG